MPRGAPSSADKALIAALKAHRLHISPYQLERWRQVGLVPRNIRCSLGRGRGTSSLPAPDALACMITVASSLDPKPSSILWLAQKAFVGHYRATKVVATRPLRTSLSAILNESDLIDVDEDSAYLRAAYFSRPQVISFSPTRNHPSLDTVPDVVAHKRHIHEHFLVASYLGVAAVGRELLTETVIQLGFATEQSADMLVDILEASFTSSARRRAVLDEVPIDDLAYYLCTAYSLLQISGRNRFWRVGVPPTDDQIARYLDSPAVFLDHIQKLPQNSSIAVAIHLIENPHFHQTSIKVLGKDWHDRCRSRIELRPFGVLIHPASEAQQTERDRIQDELAKRLWSDFTSHKSH